jgi:hypothetical protein
MPMTDKRSRRMGSGRCHSEREWQRHKHGQFLRIMGLSQARGRIPGNATLAGFSTSHLNRFFSPADGYDHLNASREHQYERAGAWTPLTLRAASTSEPPAVRLCALPVGSGASRAQGGIGFAPRVSRLLLGRLPAYLQARRAQEQSPHTSRAIAGEGGRRGYGQKHEERRCIRTRYTSYCIKHSKQN